jgi:molybdate transport system regulatory protein
MPRLKATPAPVLRLQIKHGVAIGPGKAALLEQIAACGSISQAAAALGLSYRTAWQMADSLNKDFSAPLLLSAKGGSTGGGASLTELGAEVLARYRRMEAQALAAIEDELGRFEALLRR